MGLAIIVPGISFQDSNLGKVTLAQDIPITGIAIQGNNVVVDSGELTVSYTPVNTSERGVLWSIVSGSEYATINDQGKITAKAGADNNDVVVRATSSIHPNIFAEKTINVSSRSMLDFNFVKYIALNGTAHVDTGIVPNDSHQLELFIGRSAIVEADLFGAVSNTNPSNYVKLYVGTYNNLVANGIFFKTKDGSNEAYIRWSTADANGLNKEKNFVLSHTFASYIPSDNYTAPYNWGGSYDPIVNIENTYWLGNINTGGTLKSNPEGYMFGELIIKKNEVEILHLKPAISQNGLCFFWDVISNKMFNIEGDGNISHGEIIE